MSWSRALIWTVEFDDRARKELRKLDAETQSKILSYLRERIAPSEDPTVFAKPLRHDLAGLWRFRVGDHRVIFTVEKERIVVLVLSISHRRDVYKRF